MMKKIMIMVAAIMMMATASASNKDVKNRTEYHGKIPPFSVVDINVPGRIKLVKGDEYRVIVSTLNAEDSSKLDCQVKNGVLYISTNSSEMLYGTGRGTMITVINPSEDTGIRVGSDVQTLRKKVR